MTKRFLTETARLLALLLVAMAPAAHAACTYGTSPAARTHGSGSATNTVSVTAEAGCPWTVGNTNPWVAILVGASGVGTGTVTYAVAPNPSPLERTGVVVVAGNTFTIRQSALSCSFSLSPATRTHGSGATSNSLTLNANGAGCPWTIGASPSWISIVSPATGFGTATVDYLVAANPGLEWRTGQVQIAGQTFTLIQRGISCAYDLTPATRTHGYGSASNGFHVEALAGCAWTAVADQSWISVASGATGSGPGDVGYLLAANPSGVARTGVVVVASQAFTIVQSGQPCSYGILTGNAAHSSGVETGLVMVTATPGCAWTASSADAWINITSGASGVGSGTVGYSVMANPGPGSRTGTLSVAGLTYTISQEEPSCSYRFSPTNRVHGPAATTNTFNLTAGAGCPWTISNLSPWVRLAVVSGNGPATIEYTLEANQDSLERSAVLGVSGQTMVIRQLGISCAPAVSPTTRSHGYGATSNSFSVTVSAGCNWLATPSVAWIRIASGTNGSGNGNVGYLVDANPAGVARTGSVMVADATFLIIQAAAPCVYAVTPGSRNHGHGSASNAVSITATPGCAWSVSNTNSWLTIVGAASGTGEGTVAYLVEANASLQPRSGNLVIGGQVFAITQSGTPCTTALEPAAGLHGFNLETGLVRVTTATGCPWTVVNTNNWVAVLSGAEGGTDSGTVEYVLATNPGQTPRSGNLLIGGQVFPVSQGSVSCSYRLSPTTRTHGYAAASNYATLTVSNGCTWTVVNTSAWITVVGPLSGNGSATLGYTLSPNASAAIRVGTLTVGGQSLILTQQGVSCTIALSPSARTHGSGAASNALAVTDSASCGWTVVNTNTWLTFLGSNGLGSASIGYLVAANPAPVERSGVVLVGGVAFSVVQEAAACPISLSPASRTHGPGGASNVLSVTDSTACGWSIVNTNPWITFLSAAGTGSASVPYLVAANPAAAERSGVVVVGGSAFTVMQQPAGCDLVLSPVTRLHGNGGATNTIGLALNEGCNWSITKTSAWVSILSPPSGTGSATVTYTVEANPGLDTRTTVLSIGGQPFTLSQAGMACSFRLSPSSRTHGFLAVTNFLTVNAGPSCSWSLVNTNPWITFLSAASGTGSNVVHYTVAPNLATNQRSGAIVLGDSVLNLTQRGATNGFAFEVYSIQDGSQMRLRLTGIPTGAWELQSSADLLQWSRLGEVTNATGVVDYIDPTPVNLERRFYRAVRR